MVHQWKPPPVKFFLNKTKARAKVETDDEIAERKERAKRS